MTQDTSADFISTFTLSDDEELSTLQLTWLFYVFQQIFNKTKGQYLVCMHKNYDIASWK